MCRFFPACQRRRVLYLDRAGGGRELPATVTAVDWSVDPPSYAVHIPSLGVTRETVAARLSRAGPQVRREGLGGRQAAALEAGSSGRRRYKARLPVARLLGQMRPARVPWHAGGQRS